MIAWKAFAVLLILFGIAEFGLLATGVVELTTLQILVELFSVLGTAVVFFYAFDIAVMSDASRKAAAVALSIFVLWETSDLVREVYNAYRTADTDLFVPWFTLLAVSLINALALVAAWRYTRR